MPPSPTLPFSWVPDIRNLSCFSKKHISLSRPLCDSFLATVLGCSTVSYFKPTSHAIHSPSLLNSPLRYRWVPPLGVKRKLYLNVCHLHQNAVFLHNKHHAICDSIVSLSKPLFSMICVGHVPTKLCRASDPAPRTRNTRKNDTNDKAEEMAFFCSPQF